jgi:hypothetical protein
MDGGADVTIDGGAGIDTMNVANTVDLSASTISLTSVEQIEFEEGANATDDATLASSFVDGLSVIFTDDDGSTSTEVVVTMDETSVDLSGIGFSSDFVDGTDFIRVDASALGLATTITGSSQGDTVDGSAAGDTISGAGGADTITGGLGADALTGGAGNDNFVLTSGLSRDTVADFVAGSDNVHFDLSELNGASGITASETDTLVTFDDGQAAPTDTAGGTTVAIATIDDDTATAADIDDANVIILHGGDTTFATVGAAVDAFEASGAFSLTHENDIADDDTFIFAYENSTTGFVHIAAASFENADANDGAAAAIIDDDLKGTDLMVFTDVTDVTTLTAGDFDFIA